MRQITRAKNLTYLVAEKFNIPVEKVDAVVDFYYEDLKKELILGDEHQVYLKGLGTFRGSVKKTTAHIYMLKNYLKNLKEDGTFKSIEKINTIENKITKHTNFLEKLLKQADEKKEFKKNLAK